MVFFDKFRKPASEGWKPETGHPAVSILGVLGVSPRRIFDLAVEHEKRHLEAAPNRLPAAAKADLRPKRLKTEPTTGQ